MFTRIIKISKDARMRTLADQAVVSGGNFLVGVILTRAIGVESYGIFAAGWIALMFLSSFSQALLIKPLMSLGPGRKDFQQFSATLLSLQVVFALIAFLFAAFLVPLLANAVEGYSGLVEFRWPLALLITAYLLQDHFRKHAFTDSAPGRALLLDIIAYSIYFGSMLVLIAMGALDTWTAMVCAAAGFGVGALIGFFLHPTPTMRPALLLQALRETFSYSRWLVGTAMLQWVAGQWHSLLTGALLGPAALGALRIALHVMGLLHVVYQAVENHVPVSAARLFKESGREAMMKYLVRIAIIGSAVNALALLVLCVFRNPIFHLFFGAEQITHAYLLILLAPAYLTIVPAMPLRFAARTTGKTNIIFIAYVFAAIFSLSSAVPLINHFGLTGAAIGMAGNQIIMLLALLFPYRKEWFKLCKSYMASSAKPTLNA